jgi:hypothetical protein
MLGLGCLEEKCLIDKRLKVNLSIFLIKKTERKKGKVNEKRKKV